MSVEWMNGPLLAWAGALGVTGAGGGYLLARLGTRRLRRRIEHLRGELREMEADHFFEKQALTARMRGLEKVADGLKQRTEKLRGEKVSFQMRYESLRKSYASLEKENARLAEKLRAEAARLTAQRAAAERRLEKEREAAQARIESLHAELRALREENERLQDRLAGRAGGPGEPPVLEVVPVTAEIEPEAELPDFRDSEFERWLADLRKEMERVAEQFELVQRRREEFQRDAETLMLDVRGMKARLGL